MKQPNRLHIVPTEHGVEISLPSRTKSVNVFFWEVIGLMCFVFTFLLLQALLRNVSHDVLGSEMNRLGIAFVGVAFLGGTIALGQVIVLLIRRESLLFSQHELIIQTRRIGGQHTSRYALDQMMNLRLISQWEGSQGELQFEYLSRTIRCCHYLNYVEAHDLFQKISNILKHEDLRFYFSADRVLFGTNTGNHSMPYTTLYNPDMSSFTDSLPRLTQIIIHTETADFYTIERFITYAVNYLGQGYLQHSVDVHIHGNPTKLHPNLRNSLTNLCRTVHVEAEHSQNLSADIKNHEKRDT